MEFSVREWTIIVGVLLIVAVFLDGYRRVRNERSNRIRVSLSKQVFQQSPPIAEPGGGTTNPELPNGGARVIGKRREDLRLQQSLYAKQAVPLLIEPIGIEPVAVDPIAKEPAPAPYRAVAEPFDESIADIRDEVGADESRAPFTAIEPELPEPASLPAQPGSAYEAPGLFDDEFEREEDEQPIFMAAEKRVRNFFARKDSLVVAEPKPEATEPQEVLIVNVLSKDPQGFKGPDLLQLLLACDLRFGKKNIFHRYEKANAKGAIQFSVANLVEPGSFDLDAIDNFSTPGVSFFLSLPGPEQPVTAFNYMIETAQVLVRHLHAELRDDAHSVMTAQTIEHCRQRIRDFERKQLTLQL